MIPINHNNNEQHAKIDICKDALSGTHMAVTKGCLIGLKVHSVEEQSYLLL